MYCPPDGRIESVFMFSDWYESCLTCSSTSFPYAHYGPVDILRWVRWCGEGWQCEHFDDQPGIATLGGSPPDILRDLLCHLRVLVGLTNVRAIVEVTLGVVTFSFKFGCPWCTCLGFAVWHFQSSFQRLRSPSGKSLLHHWHLSATIPLAWCL